MNTDKNELKVQALLERLSSLTLDYENKIADLRVELTISKQEEGEAKRALAEEQMRHASNPEVPSN